MACVDQGIEPFSSPLPPLRGWIDLRPGGVTATQQLKEGHCILARGLALVEDHEPGRRAGAHGGGGGHRLGLLFLRMLDDEKGLARLLLDPRAEGWPSSIVVTRMDFLT